MQNFKLLKYNSEIIAKNKNFEIHEKKNYYFFMNIPNDQFHKNNKKKSQGKK
jgi:hypothetical protein